MVQNVKDLGRFLTSYTNELQDIVNGNLDLELNIRGKIMTVNFVTASVDVQVDHNLGYIPTGYYVIKTSHPSSLYTGSGTWTSNSISLRSNAVATMNIFIF